MAELKKDRQRYQNLVEKESGSPIQLEQIETEDEATLKKLDAVNGNRKRLTLV